MFIVRFLSAAFAVSSGVGLVHAAPISITSATNFVYSENFNSINSTIQATSSGSADSSWQDDVDLPGWYATAQSTTATAVPLALRSTGGGSSGAIYNYGAATADTDRALGSVAASSNTYRYGVRLVNNTDATITSFSFTYDGEQWRQATGTPVANQIVPSYAVFAAGAGSISDATAYQSLDASATFTTPNSGAAADSASAPLNGNLAANRVAGISSGTITVNLTIGSELWIRFSDGDSTSNDHGVAIDNLVVSVPEPASLALVGCGAALALRRRR